MVLEMQGKIWHDTPMGSKVFDPDIDRKERIKVNHTTKHGDKWATVPGHYRGEQEHSKVKKHIKKVSAETRQNNRRNNGG